MENINEILSKVTELTVINTQQIEKLKNKDEDISTSVIGINDLVNTLINFSKGVSKEINNVKKENESLKLDLDDLKEDVKKQKELSISTTKVTNMPCLRSSL